MSSESVVVWSLVVAATAGAIFWMVHAYVRHRRRQTEAEQKRTQERAKRAEQEKKEKERKDTLRRRDGEVDPILKRLVAAKLSLQQMLKSIDKSDLQPADLDHLREWTQNHSHVMDFSVFKEITECLPEPNQEQPVLLKDEIQQLLDEHCDAETCLEYADEKLGIQRRFECWDGDNSGGVNCETGDGRYEDVNERLERILRSLPGTDRGYVYILTNASLPGLLKVGKSHRDPEERAAELSDHSGIPTVFVVAFKTIVSNCGLVESIVHRRLSARRVAANREFFSMSVREAVRIIEDVSQEVDKG